MLPAREQIFILAGIVINDAEAEIAQDHHGKYSSTGGAFSHLQF
jgi:hypothetical protein